MGFFNWVAPLFGRYADRWDDEGIEQVVGWLRPFLRAGSEGPADILDVGGGTGALALRLHDAMGARVTVLDPTPEMLSYVPKTESVTPVLGSAESMPFEDDSFDAVIVTDAFHHFRDQQGAAREFARVVRSGGGVVVLEMDPRGWMRLIVAGEKMLGEPGSFLTPDEMCAFMAAQGIAGECHKTKGVSYRYVGRVR